MPETDNEQANENLEKQIQELKQEHEIEWVQLTTELNIREKQVQEYEKQLLELKNLKSQSTLDFTSPTTNESLVNDSKF